MEMKKIDKMLNFEVEAQGKCEHGYNHVSSKCASDCYEEVWAMQSYEEKFMNGGIKHPNSKCYVWGSYYTCSTSHWF